MNKVMKKIPNTVMYILFLVVCIGGLIGSIYASGETWNDTYVPAVVTEKHMESPSDTVFTEYRTVVITVEEKQTGVTHEFIRPYNEYYLTSWDAGTHAWWNQERAYLSGDCVNKPFGFAIAMVCIFWIAIYLFVQFGYYDSKYARQNRRDSYNY